MHFAIYRKKTGLKQLTESYQVLLVGEHQDDSIAHKWIIDYGLEKKLLRTKKRLC